MRTTVITARRHSRRAALRPATVLLVEDDRAQMQALKTALEARAFSVITASTGAEALERIHADSIDLILLDLGLPDADGLEVCKRLRVWTKRPIVVVTADQVEDRMIDALDLGADDYVVKPYRMPVLMARVRVALRHDAVARLEQSTRLEIGDMQLDLDAHQVTVAGEPVEMSEQQFAMLAVLARNAGKIVTYNAMARALWGYEPSEHDLSSLRNGISRIRQNLGTGRYRPVIHNERMIGYRLTPPAEE